MNESRYTSIRRSTSGLALKVLDALPRQEAWSSSQVIAELARQGSSAVRDRRTIEGCLDSLVSTGLAIEIGQRTDRRYRHVHVNCKQGPQPLEAPKEAEVKPEQTPPPKAGSPTPVDRLGKAAADLRKLAENLHTSARLLTEAAASVEDAALDVDQDLTTGAERLAKFTALQQALSALTSLQPTA